MDGSVKTGASLLPHEFVAWAGLLHVHATIVRQLDAELQAAHQLPLSTYEVLLFLAKAPERRLRMSEIAGQAVLSLSGLSRLVDRLAGAGLVCRQRATEDQRGNYVVLTPQGLERFEAARATHVAGIRRYFLSQLSADDLERLGEYWERLVPGTMELILGRGAAEAAGD